MHEWILGLGGSDHDFSAALMRKCDIRIAIEQERLSRRKHGLSLWYQNPVQQSIDHCLSEAGISIADVGVIVSSDVLPARVRHDLRDRRFREYPHHLCHAASAYLMLPAGSTAGVLVYDGFGSVTGMVEGDSLRNYRETFSFFIFGPKGYTKLGGTTGIGYIEQEGFQTGVTNSVGMLYELVTSLLGYGINDSGKTMGLSSHGMPRYLDIFERFVSYNDDISDCFVCPSGDSTFTKTLEEILIAGRGSFSVKADLAASVQAVTNKALAHSARFFCGREIDHLCIAGGCGLNTVANSFLVEQCQMKVPIIIPPHCGDAGIGFGALWLERFAESGAVPSLTFRGKAPAPALSRPGKCYTREECRRAVQEFYPKLAIDFAIGSPSELAGVIADGSIVGVFNGGSEVGPRALGGRSIMANPRSSMTREKINRLVKRREPFRPLAPIILQSQYSDYFFDCRHADTYMLKVARARERCLREAPAVVHVDGTARVQVVPDDGDPFLTELLRAFREKTGTGILLNTSFNRRGEPIVESPLDAVDACLGMNLDGLYLEGEFYRPVS